MRCHNWGLYAIQGFLPFESKTETLILKHLVRKGCKSVEKGISKRVGVQRGLHTWNEISKCSYCLNKGLTLCNRMFGCKNHL